MKHKQSSYMISALLLCFAMVFCLSAGISRAEDDSLIALNGPGNAAALAQDGQGGFYVLAAAGLQHYMQDTKQFEPVSMPEDKLCFITWDGTKLLGLGSGGRNVYAMQGPGWVLVCSLNGNENNVLPDFNLSTGILPMHFVASQDFILLTYADPVDYQEKTIRVDASTGTYINLDYQDFFPLCLYKNQTVLALAKVSGDYGVYIYDPAGGELSSFALPEGLPLLCRAASYHEETGTLFWVSSAGQLFSVPEGEKSIFVNHSVSLKSVVSLSGESLAFLDEQGMYLCNTAASQNAPYITVYGSGLLDNMGFTAETGIRVAQADAAFNGMELFSYILSTRDSTIDVFGVLTYDGFSLMKEKGMFVDLRQSSALVSLSKELYPKLQEAIQGPNGELAGWPIDVQPIMRYDDGVQEILARYGIKYPNTFDEMLDAAQVLISDGVLEELDLQLFDTMQYTRSNMFQFFLKSYIMQKQMSGEPIRFDTPSLERITRRIMTEVPDVRASDSIEDEKSGLFSMECISPIIREISGYPLRIDEETPAAVQTLCAVGIINPYSNRIPEAIAYLEYAAKRKDAYAYYMYASMNKPLPNGQYETTLAEKKAALLAAQNDMPNAKDPARLNAQIEALQYQISQLKNEQWQVSPEAIAQYQVAANYLYISDGTRIAFDDGIQQYAKRLLDGQIDVKEFIDLCNKRVEMIYKE